MLWPENRPAWRAWLFLQNGEERIPLSEIESYARIFGTDPAALAGKIKAIENQWRISQKSESS
jgi:hypothetical protein